MNGIKNAGCCGCNACVLSCSVGAINKIINHKGFFDISIDSQKCINCNICEGVCPIQGDVLSHNLVASYGYFNNVVNDRMSSQSGGAFAAISKYIFFLNGSVYGVSFEFDEARYIRVTNMEELKSILGSKYVQARTDNVFLDVENDLIEGKVVLFSGTPCHVSGLLNYLKVGGVETKNLYTVDIICHGTPSPQIFKEYRNELIDKYGECLNFNFRDKLCGWHDHICSFSANEHKYYSRDYVNIFYSHLCLNETCYDCKYSSMHRVGDISLGDLWGCNENFSFLKENMGTSLFLVNSNKGFFLKEHTQGCFTELAIEKCMQPNLYRPTEKPSQYYEFNECYLVNGYKYSVREYKLLNHIEKSSVQQFWNEYDMERLLTILSQHEVLLYGIGLTMLQLLEWIKCYDISVKGILDRNAEYIGQIIEGISVIEPSFIPEDNKFTILICSKNKSNTDIIFDRLYNDNNFNHKNIQIIRLTDMRWSNE